MPKGRCMALLVVCALALAACGEDDAEQTATSIITHNLSTTSTALGTTTTTQPTITTSPAETTTTSKGPTVQVFDADPSSDCVEDMPVVGVDHAIDESEEPITAAFRLWLTSELDETPATGMLRSAELEDGLLTIDFADLRYVMNNASTTCGAFTLRAELNATAFQFPAVDNVIYQIEGSCKTFEDWLQRGECHVYSRSQAEHT